MKNQQRKLNILMNGQHVGLLEKLPNLGLQFTYNESWIKSKLDDQFLFLYRL